MQTAHAQGGHLHTPGHARQLLEPVCNELPTSTLCYVSLSLFLPLSEQTQALYLAMTDNVKNSEKQCQAGGTLLPQCWDLKSELEMVKFCC